MTIWIDGPYPGMMVPWGKTPWWLLLRGYLEYRTPHNWLPNKFFYTTPEGLTEMKKTGKMPANAVIR